MYRSWEMAGPEAAWFGIGLQEELAWKFLRETLEDSWCTRQEPTSRWKRGKRITLNTTVLSNARLERARKRLSGGAPASGNERQTLTAGGGADELSPYDRRFRPMTARRVAGPQ